MVFEANLLFCAYSYFSLRNLFFNITLESVSANLVPYYHYNLAIYFFCYIAPNEIVK